MWYHFRNVLINLVSILLSENLTNKLMFQFKNVHWIKDFLFQVMLTKQNESDVVKTSCPEIQGATEHLKNKLLYTAHDTSFLNDPQYQELVSKIYS